MRPEVVEPQHTEDSSSVGLRVRGSGSRAYEYIVCVVNAVCGVCCVVCDSCCVC